MYKEDIVSNPLYLENANKQLLYKLKLPKKSKFKVVSQGEDFIKFKVSRKTFTVWAKSTADWLTINCQDTITQAGLELFDYLRNLTKCDYYYTSKRLIINKRSDFIDVVTSYE